MSKFKYIKELVEGVLIGAGFVAVLAWGYIFINTIIKDTTVTATFYANKHKHEENTNQFYCGFGKTGYFFVSDDYVPLMDVFNFIEEEMSEKGILNPLNKCKLINKN